MTQNAAPRRLAARSNGENCTVSEERPTDEPPDLWEARLPKKYVDLGPKVERTFPTAWSEVDPACHDARARVKWMDANGIHAQVIYPNFVAFEGFAIMALKDLELQVVLIRTYNDYLIEFASVDPTLGGDTRPSRSPHVL